MMLDAAPDLTRRFLDIVQGLTAVGVAALVSMVFNLRDTVTGIKMEISRLKIVDGRGEQHAVQLGQHEVRLDGHDRDIETIRRFPPYSQHSSSRHP